MNTTTYLLDENYIKSVSNIGDEVDSKYLGPALMKSQQMGLLPLIGESLYDTICSMVDDGSIEDEKNKEYKKLLEVYIASYLIQKVQAQVQLSLFAKMKNAGIVNYVDANEQQLDLKSIQYLINMYEQDATFYGRRMTDYLSANSKLYPEYKVCKNDEMRANSDWTSFCKITI